MKRDHPKDKVFGAVLYLDASGIDWLEGRGPRVYLVQLTDKGTGRVFARFVKSNSVRDYVRAFSEYLREWGRPRAIHTNYANRFLAPSRSGSARRSERRSFGRLLDELEIRHEREPAASRPPRRGLLTLAMARRLRAEMRQAGVDSLESADRFLGEVFLPGYNAPLSGQVKDVHRRLESSRDLNTTCDRILWRIVRLDLTFRLAGRKYRVSDRKVPAGSKLEVRATDDGQFSVHVKGRSVAYEAVQPAAKPGAASPRPRIYRSRPASPQQRQWMRRFKLTRGPTLRDAIKISNRGV